MTKRRFLCTLLALSLLVLTGCAQAVQGTEMMILKIGKADAIVITSGEHAVLIDAGEDEDGEEILEYLATKNVKALDAMIITHFDKDHVGGADWVLSGIPVRAVYDANYESDSAQYQQYLSALARSGTQRYRVSEGITVLNLDGGRLTLTLIATYLDTEDENNQSIVVSMQDKWHTFFFAADATEPRIEELLSGSLGAHDFLKMPHHGRYKENLPALLDVVNPRIAAITDSDKNPADDETLSLLAARGTETYTTRNGNIHITSNDKGLKARQ